jgi:hypothetical protein
VIGKAAVEDVYPVVLEHLAAVDPLLPAAGPAPSAEDLLAERAHRVGAG